MLSNNLSMLERLWKRLKVTRWCEIKTLFWTQKDVKIFMTITLKLQQTAQNLLQRVTKHVQQQLRRDISQILTLRSSNPQLYFQFETSHPRNGISNRVVKFREVINAQNYAKIHSQFKTCTSTKWHKQPHKISSSYFLALLLSKFNLISIFMK